jgi:hypothetical protein
MSAPREKDDLVGLDLVGIQESCQSARDCAGEAAVLRERLGRDGNQTGMRLPGCAVLAVQRREVLDVGGDQSTPRGRGVSKDLVVRQ